MSMTLIVALWRHRLSSPSPTVWRHSTDAVRIIVVAPRELLVDDRHVDYFFQIPSPQHRHDEDHSRLFAKVRELAITFGSTERRLCCFERSLQCELASLRHELGIVGVAPNDYRIYSNRAESKMAARRGGVTTARFCTVGPIQSAKVIGSWISKVELQIGRYPLTVKRSASIDDHHHHHRVPIVIDCRRDLQLWMAQRAGDDQSPNHQHEVILEECLRQGNEFWAMCTAAHGLIGTMVVLDRDSSGMHESCRNERAYSIEYVNADETRDIYPGIESFVAQTVSALFARRCPVIVFVKGYYRAYNAIYFLGVSLQAPSYNDSFAQLFRLVESYGWEWSVIDGTIDDDASMTPTNNSIVNTHHHHHQVITRHHVLINFPLQAGSLLMHQSILRHHNKRTEIRQLWCTSEAFDEEDSKSDNQQQQKMSTKTLAANSTALQVFVSGSDRAELIADVHHIMKTVELAVDRCNVTMMNRTKNSSNGSGTLQRSNTTSI